MTRMNDLGKRLMRCTILASVSLLWAANGHAAIFGVTDVTGGAVTTEGVDGTTRAYGFTPTVDIQLLSLGLWDEDQDGLVNAHQIGVWDSAQTLLVSTTVQSGTSSAAQGPVVQGGVFRYESIPTISLLAGNEYFIGAQYFDPVVGPRDGFINFNGTTTTAAEISITTFRAARFNVFDFPTTVFGGTSGYFGPNFEFMTAAAAPEPGTVALMLGGLLLTYRTRRQS